MLARAYCEELIRFLRRFPVRNITLTIEKRPLLSLVDTMLNNGIECFL